MPYNGGFMQRFLRKREKKKVFERREKTAYNTIDHDRHAPFFLKKKIKENIWGHTFKLAGILVFVIFIILITAKYHSSEDPLHNDSSINENIINQKSFDKRIENGDYYFNQSNYSLAIKHYKYALELFPDNKIAQEKIAQANESMRQKD